MRSPYLIDGPAVIAFSGGRTSGLMLYRIIEAHGGTLPPDVVPVFCNTGKEHDATLDFVRDCADRWGASIRWVEYRDTPETSDRWAETDHQRASRDGQPFAALISRLGYLPNPVSRFCTQEMKIRASQRFAESALGMAGGHTRVVGLRADEPGRVSRARARALTGKDGGRLDLAFPLYEAGATVGDVRSFWQGQPFDLGLPMASDGTTPAGNCDLCFLKSGGKIASIIAVEPHRAGWWAAQESATGNTFRKDRQSYSAMLAQGVMFVDDDDLIDCACTD